MQTLLKETQAYTLLKNEGAGVGFSHAYLLLFEDAKYIRVALKTFAKLFFACDTPTSASEKRVSDLIDNESFSDCIHYPVEGKKLVVEDAERILEESNLAPVEGERKVFLIGDFAEANIQTQNKLLKVLEEPPKNVIFLLGASSAFPVLPTVLSRTKRLEIQPFSTAEITECLGRIYGDKYDRQTLGVCAATSGGSVGSARNLLEGGFYETLTEWAFSLALAPLQKLPVLSKQVGDTSYKKELLSLLRLIFRDALLYKTGGRRGYALLQAERTRVEEVAKLYDARALLLAQEYLSEAEKQVQFNGIFSQCIELCLAKIKG